MSKKRTILIITAVLLLAGLWAFIRLSQTVSRDSCLDRGGSWVEGACSE